MESKSKDTFATIDDRWKNFAFDPKKVETLEIKNFISDEHIDIMVRYLYVKSYVEKNNHEKYKAMYEKMQNNRIGKCNTEAFNYIIDSFKNYSFLKEYPIPINNQNKMLNGSHRLACCLYFNINPYVVKFDEQDHYYDIEWFKKNGFSKNELEELIKTKEELIKKYSEKNVELNNIYSAMISPLQQDESLDVEYFKLHANKLFDNGIKGLFICGNTGNGMNLSIDVKKSILKESINMKKFSIICHVGCETEAETFEFVKVTNNCNIKCIASMPPYKYINTYTNIKKYYERLAKLSNKPVLIYHIPSITGIDLSDKELIDLLKINNVIGIKYTDTNMEKLKAISTAMPQKYIFFGRDDFLIEGITNGATGGIGGCYNLFPTFVYNIINKNNPEENQRKLNYCIKHLRKIYPTLPGGEFVLKALQIKNDMPDNVFFEYIKGEEND